MKNLVLLSLTLGMLFVGCSSTSGSDEEEALEQEVEAEVKSEIKVEDWAAEAAKPVPNAEPAALKPRQATAPAMIMADSFICFFLSLFVL